MENVRGNFAVPPGIQPEAMVSDDLRVGMKVDICHGRSKFEVYNFATRYNLSEAAIDELLQMLGNVGNIEPEVFEVVPLTPSGGMIEPGCARLSALDPFHFIQHLTLL